MNRTIYRALVALFAVALLPGCTLYRFDGTAAQRGVHDLQQVSLTQYVILFVFVGTAAACLYAAASPGQLGERGTPRVLAALIATLAALLLTA